MTKKKKMIKPYEVRGFDAEGNFVKTSFTRFESTVMAQAEANMLMSRHCAEARIYDARGTLVPGKSGRVEA
jgi:hypothetical protein